MPWQPVQRAPGRIEEAGLSYTLKPEGEEARENAAAARVTQPVSVLRVGIGVGIGSIFIFSLAGLPSWSRHPRPTPVPGGMCHTGTPLIEIACWKDLSLAFADLIEMVDPVTHQRPTYPTTADLFARLIPIPQWQRAVLFEIDASVSELQAAGLGDEQHCLKLNYGNALGMENRAALLACWQLVLTDDGGCIVGRISLDVPTLDVAWCGDGNDEAEIATYPVLDQRFPDWPRIAVFNRPSAEAQSDG